MFFFPISILIFVILLLLAPILFFLLQAGIVSVAFTKLGLTPYTGFAFFILSLIGSGINIPIKSEETPRIYHDFFAPRVITERKCIYINVGGAILPLMLAIWLLPGAEILPLIISILVVTAVAKALTRPVKGRGFVIPAFIPPIVSAGLAILLARGNPAPVAYISGVVGTLLGADILNLGKIYKLESNFVSIGGAGIFDGIYLVGIISVLLA